MKKLFMFLVASSGFYLAACGTRGNLPKEVVPGEKIGTYDSRAVILAYFGTPHFNAWMTGLRERYDKAKAAGDAAGMKAAEEEGKARQKKMHMQGFSTAPVDDALKAIKDQLPEIAKKAGVGPLISKWDKAGLAKYPSAEQVDVTMALVEAFHPIERQRKIIPEMLKTEPLPLEEVEKMPEDE
jgi:hypothetical protein